MGPRRAGLSRATARELLLGDKNPAAAEGLTELGAAFASTDEVASSCSDTTTSVPVVDTEIAKALKQRGIDYVDAPIAGGARRAGRYRGAHNGRRPRPIGGMVQRFTQEAVARFGPGADQSQLMAGWYER